MSQSNSCPVMIDPLLYETSLSLTISLYLSGTLLDVLIRDTIIENMISNNFIHTMDVMYMFDYGIIPSVCLSYLNYLFIARDDTSTQDNSSDHIHSVQNAKSVTDTPMELDSTGPNHSSDNIKTVYPGYYTSTSEIQLQDTYISHSLSENHCKTSDIDMLDQPDVKPPPTVLRNKNNNSSENSIHESVVNLSHRQLSSTDINILQRGMKFCPTPGEPDISELHDDLDKLHLRLKRYLHFYKLSPPDDSTLNQDVTIVPTPNMHEPFKHQKFKLPSAWIPPPVINLENFIFKNHRDLSGSTLPKIRNHNITKEERLALNDLAKDTNIVIKPADKGGAVVVWDRANYIKEGLRQLSDNNFYVETDTDLTSKHYKEVVTILDDMHSLQEIDISCYKYLTHTPIRTAQFYMLPKIHKDKTNPPGRPIVSGNGCPTERISQFVDFFLQPGVKNIRSYIKDTTHFLSVLSSLNILPEGAILATLDVSSLYTNIPNVEGIEACRIMLNNIRPNARAPFNDSLIKLLTQVLSKNNFDFNEKHYLQTGGTAMGTRVAPSYANTFMGWFEDEFVYTHDPSPLVWKRFIDDIFIIWTHGLESLQDFYQHLNNCLPSIKFEMDQSTSHIHFLDVTVSIDDQHSIQTDLYTKPTDSHNYLNYKSAHPRHCRDGIPYSQFLRLKRICSTEATFTHQCREMSKNFIRADYPPGVIREAFARVYNLDRLTLLNQIPLVEEDDEAKDKTFLITTFHPNFRECDKIVGENWDLLDKSSSTRPLLKLDLIKGNRRAKNLRDILVRARLPKPKKITATSSRGKHPASAPCTKAYCQYCRMINKSGRIKSRVTHKEYNTRSKVSCRSNNIVYCLCCTICGRHYVGQTKRPLVERLREHIRNINQETQIHIVGRHFNEPDHTGTQALEVQVLNFAKGHPDSKTSLQMRLELESTWIKRLRSFVPAGLNLMNTSERKKDIY